MSANQPGTPDFVAPADAAPLAAGPYAPHADDTAPVVPAATPETTPGTVIEVATPNVPAAPRRPSHRPSRRAIATTGIVVAVVVAGLAAWFVRQQIVNPAPACKPISGAKYTASDGSFPSLPVALLDGQPIPTKVEVIGVWCDVALLDLEYQQKENLNGDHAFTAFNTDVLRAVDISTGKVLWTLDKAPDGSPLMFNSAVSADGKLALATMRDSGFTQPDGSELCIGGTDVQILNLHTGHVMTSTFVDGQCTPATSTDDTQSTMTSVVAYQAGVVVIEQARGNVLLLPSGGAISTSGYQDTDLSTALWTIDAANAGTLGPVVTDASTDRTLPGGWVRTADDGMYVPIATGDSSHVSSDGQTRAFFTAGNLAIEADTSAAGGNGFADISGWTDLTASAPAWTYTPPSGWVIAQDEYLMDDFPWPKSATPVVAVTSDAVVIQEERFDDSGVVEANLTAVSTADGTALWSTPYRFAKADLATVNTITLTVPTTTEETGDGSISVPCTDPASCAPTTTTSPFSLLARANAAVIHSGGKELLVYNEPENVILADAATGKAIASQAMSAKTASGVYPCGDSSVCVAVDFGNRANTMQITTTGIMKMSVSASALGAPAETDLTLMTSGYATTNVGYDGLYPTNAGLFGVVRQGSDLQPGDYLFVLI